MSLSGNQPSLELTWALTQADPFCTSSQANDEQSCTIGIFATTDCSGANLLEPAPIYIAANTLALSKNPEQVLSILNTASAGTWVPDTNTQGTLTAATRWVAGSVAVFNQTGFAVVCSRLSFSS